MWGPLAVSLAYSLQSSVVSVKDEATNQPPSGQAPWEKNQQPVGSQFACVGALAPGSPGPPGQLCSIPFSRGSGSKAGEGGSVLQGSPT